LGGVEVRGAVGRLALGGWLWAGRGWGAASSSRAWKGGSAEAWSVCGTRGEGTEQLGQSINPRRAPCYRIAASSLLCGSGVVAVVIASTITTIDYRTASALLCLLPPCVRCLAPKRTTLPPAHVISPTLDVDGQPLAAHHWRTLSMTHVEHRSPPSSCHLAPHLVRARL
jgi:hypothetical protein